MRTSSIISLSILGVLATAAPTAAVRDDSPQVYQLKVSSPLNQELDGRWLSLDGSDVGLSTYDASPIQVFPVDSPTKKGCSELHTYPIGIVDHAVGLVGSQSSFMSLVDIVNPAGKKPEPGTQSSWQEFLLASGQVTNEAVAGKWIAFPDENGTWRVKWSDGTALTTADNMPINITYHKVDSQDS